MKTRTLLLFLCYYLDLNKALPQHPEINDEFETTTASEDDDNYTTVSNTTELDTTTLKTAFVDNKPQYQATKLQQIIGRFYKIISVPIEKILESAKVNSVVRNVGTCVVNGFMELVTYYFPAPFIPLIASAAGMVIPFEPVVMLRRRMPVTSYRRAIKTAVSSFLNTFDRFKTDNDDDDPYMTRRFNRRFMNDNSKGEKKST